MPVTSERRIPKTDFHNASLVINTENFFIRPVRADHYESLREAAKSYFDVLHQTLQTATHIRSDISYFYDLMTYEAAFPQGGEVLFIVYPKDQIMTQNILMPHGFAGFHGLRTLLQRDEQTIDPVEIIQRDIVDDKGHLEPSFSKEDAVPYAGAFSWWTSREGAECGHSDEAVQAILHFGMTKLGLRQIAMRHVINDPSENSALYRKVGFVKIDEIDAVQGGTGLTKRFARYRLTKIPLPPREYKAIVLAP